MLHIDGSADLVTISKAQRARLLQQIELYVDESGVEQQIRLSHELPTLQEYRQRRMGTSAVGVFLALTESVSIASYPSALR